ncbi:MAG: HAMP domain-containing histidine kinase [Gammaproteobacteria bacterium]|nr:HAMP domain-containing histidine kinase [Gammaproteobacteria bacterium]
MPNALIKGHDRRRLRNLLAILFLALTIPTAVLVWHAYGQLKWEAFHQYRGLAEELTGRIDARLVGMISAADTNSFADYTFLVVTGDPSANFLQRSPLSAYPVPGDPPGLLGHFQVDTRGVFSSPLLPPATSDPEQFGIGGNEFKNRWLLAQEIHQILADNRLVRLREQASYHALTEGDIEAEAEPLETRPGSAERPAMNEQEEDAELTTYTQQVFDQLSLPGRREETDSDVVAAPDGEAAPVQQRLNTIGKVSDLNLDPALERKSEAMESQSDQRQRDEAARADGLVRGKRKEQIALAETAAKPAEDRFADTAAGLRISTFESEVDPLEFSMLDSGHLVLFRKVWREGERFIQGLLIDRDTFIGDAIDTPFRETALSGTSNLIVAYRGDVIHSVSGRDDYEYPVSTGSLEGALVYRNRLSAPLDSMELIYSASHLPPGPGAAVLGWVTLVLAIVFISGFVTLYRLGLGQIRLARQQQDFVSAVSHELKTPLTSIRMYSEMLKEGWADEEKRKTYYEFIHGESERLTRLISNVLQLAKITRNEPQFDLQPRKVGELMANMESKITSQVERGGFRLAFDCQAETRGATVMIDEDCFSQIVINLVDNAIKFSSSAANKTIEINSRLTSDNKVRFSVRDFGPGIAKNQMKKIFRLFYRPESELTRETVGTGIGLAIVHQLTVVMNGKVDVINRQPGAEFSATFPSVTPS